jgi:hypothetical protein
MPNVIIVRLHPDQSVAGTDFTNYLNGLNITAYDISYAHAKPDPATLTQIGQAKYLPGGDPNFSDITKNQIQQHASLFFGGFANLVDVNSGNPESVATAMIEVQEPAGYPEYVGPDLLLQISRGGTTITEATLYYNVVTQNVGALPATSEGILAAFGNPSNTSLYLPLPAPTSNLLSVLPSDGSAPDFKSLDDAVKTVLKADPGGALPDLGSLSVDQCRNIAYEIVWGPQPPLPGLPQQTDTIDYTGALEEMYTDPPNDGSLSNKLETSRQQFEGGLQGYYATNNALAEKLTKFVVALAAAYYCNNQTAAATSAYLTFPPNPNPPSPPLLSTESEAEVNITGLAAGSLAIPTQYFYVLSASQPIQITAAQRYSMAVGDQSSRVEAALQAGVDDGIVTGALNPNINPAQAARRLGALVTPPASAASCAVTPTIQVVVNDWLAYAGDELFRLSGTTVATTTAANYSQPASAANVGVTMTSTTGMSTGRYLYIQGGGYYSVQSVAGNVATLQNLGYSTNAAPGTVVNSGASVGATTFWQPEPARAGFLDLVLCALTDGYIVNDPAHLPAAPLADKIKAGLMVGSPAHAIANVADLSSATPQNWEDFFHNSPGWANSPPDLSYLPPFTAPGTPEVRVKAFIRYVQKFFDLAFSTLPPGAQLNAIPTLPLPSVDLITDWVTQYTVLIGGAFTFGAGALNQAQAQAAAANIPEIAADPDAQAWLVQRVSVLNDLCLICDVPASPPWPAPSHQFSVAEALYARGYISIADVQAVTLADFQDSLRGTVAYDLAPTIYAAAGAVGPQPPPPLGPFQAINPGTLTDCIPPCHLSPLGPVEYLQKLLQLSEVSTCGDPCAPPAKGHQTLGDVVATRRGPLGNLHATAANLDTELPLIDIVNENLENLVVTIPGATAGVVYDTAEDELAGHKLCPYCCDECKDKEDVDCHQPDKIFAALPEYSAPATPVAQPAAYDDLKSDFSAPCLPYSEPLDICRSYLEQMGTCRFETMRTFRKEITQFALDPTLAAPTFQTHLWRFPVQIDTAIEYLGITPEEYQLLFQADLVEVPTPGHLLLQELYGFDINALAGQDWTEIVVQLSEFLKRTGLTYCEAWELEQSGFVNFEVVSSDQEGEEQSTLPRCEPCCLSHWSIVFVDPPDPHLALKELAIFIRLWRKLQAVCGARYSFTQLVDICNVLQLFQGGAVNPDFIRQLAAFQILRDHFRLALASDSVPKNATGEDRAQLLSLWVGPGAAHWKWAVSELLRRAQHYAKSRHHAKPQTAEFVKLLASNLDPLSRLAGFNPAIASDTWNALPTHTLRFAEVLAKIYASHFGVGELLYLFTADDHLDGDDPFPLQEPNEALDMPLALPDDEHEHALWALRKKLLAVEISEEDAHEWTWPRIANVLHSEFGYPSAGPDPLLSLGKHFFPAILETHGIPVSAVEQQYREHLPGANPAMWNTPPDGPFRYDVTTSDLWTQVPLLDRRVIEKLIHVRQLNPAEMKAVQNLYFAPRLDLAPFGCLFTDLAAAERYLIQETHEEKRWHYFRRHFALTYKRCQIIAAHLAEHVAAVTGSEWEGSIHDAWFVLQNLFADGNLATAPWENDAGMVPGVTWSPPPNGGGFAAVLGLTGTGLLGEYSAPADKLIWREERGPMSAFGEESNESNAPLPTILPAMDLTLTPEQLQLVGIRNGFAINDASAASLGGAEGFSVRWSGVLLVDEEGTYEFKAGAPTPDGEEPDLERAEDRQWQVTISRGQKTWVVLRHHWQSGHGEPSSSLPLKRGAYNILVEFIQKKPAFSAPDEVCPQHTGFQVKYRGLDSHDRLVALPLERLFRDAQDQTLDSGIQFPEDSTAQKLLRMQYTSSLRDIRRTYQRAFKALLFAHRLGLTAKPIAPYRQSELGYMLAHQDLFAGVSYYRNPGFTRHAADFNFNFFPLADTYEPPPAAEDDRVQPSLERIQAMFDWWERMFDYVRMRKQASAAREHPVWLLFEEAAETQPDNPAQLLRHMDVDLRHAGVVLSYFVSQGAPVYPVTSDDLEDDRWAVRVWHGELWVRHLLRCFASADISVARPDLWASDDPAALVAGEAHTGNENLTKFVDDGCFEIGKPRRYLDVKRLNDGLRERARRALLAYLCGMDRVPLPWPPNGTAQSPKDLSALLLLDVQVGICEKASRIEEAISAVQSFIRRARLGLEPSWTITPQFALLWDREFATFKIWEACKRRKIYKENWIDWDEFSKAKKIEAFQFLESELRRCTLTMPVAGGGEYWPDQLPPSHPALLFLQRRDPSSLRLLNPAREGLGVLGTPEWDARPSWLAPLASENDQEESPPAPVEIALPAASRSQDSSTATPLPFWIESAIRLGTRFYRVAAAGVPPASARFLATDFHPRPGCCKECACEQPALVDEYYFWLEDCAVYIGDVPDPKDQTIPHPYDIEPNPQDPSYDHTASGPTSQTSTTWHDPTQLPTLLSWAPQPAVRLAWCRVHNGQFQQRRQSVDAVVIDTAAGAADLTYVGRVSDSLTFAVTSGVAPVGYDGAEQPGFRFDLASDDAVILPLVQDPPPPPPPANPYPAKLPAYPYFVFVDPGDRLFPGSLFAPALAVANTLRSHCRFEAALKWLELVFNPLQDDCTWIRCGEEDTSPPDQAPVDTCCDSTKISDDVARNRSIILHFLEILLEWAKALRRVNSPEAFEQARLLLDTAAAILGPRPLAVMNCQPAVPPLFSPLYDSPLYEENSAVTVTNLVPLRPPLNPRLMELYCHVADQLRLIHDCDSARRLHNGAPNLDMPYWGEVPCRRNWRGLPTICAEDATWCYPHSPYRFLFLVQKAKEIVAQVRELGSALLASLEKGDAEYLASMRQVHETQLMDLTLRVRQNQWRDADWQVQALGLTKQVSQTNRRYYAGLIQDGLDNDEQQYEGNTSSALGARTASTTIEGIGEFMNLIPDLFVGFPCEETWLPLGTKLSGMFMALARISNDLAEISGTTASLNLTEAGWDRRLQEWVHQVEDLDIEIEQVELQILGAERRRDQALQEINNTQLQIEQSREQLNFLRDKFTSHELYLFLQKETAGLYYRAYELAFYASLQAQHAFNFERGHTHRNFLPCSPWDNLHQGLLAGERLDVALRQMEKEYLDLNCREYEITKHISLRLHFPMQYLRLLLTGRCDFEIAEWRFDVDYPGMYLRRIKNVALTLPCVTGPYTGVHCKLTLLSSQTRVDPCLSPSPECCCREKEADCRCHPAEHTGYEARSQDPRVFRHYTAREAIATSMGQNDTGLFQLNFNDDRYLPFEYHGAVSRWRLELPVENNYFDMYSLSDVVLQLNYTAREGGDALRCAARESARCKLPGDGWAFFDVRHEFPDAWELFRRACRDRRDRDLTLRFTRKLFPFLPRDPEIRITEIGLLFETEEMLKRHCPEIKNCPCPEKETTASYVVRFRTHRDEDDCECGEPRFTCVASEEWPKFYCGCTRISLRPFRHGCGPNPVSFCFPESAGEIVRAFLLCHYEVVDECCEARRRDHIPGPEAGVITGAQWRA